MGSSKFVAKIWMYFTKWCENVSCLQETVQILSNREIEIERVEMEILKFEFKKARVYAVKSHKINFKKTKTL